MLKRKLRNCQILIIVNSSLFKILKIFKYLSDNFKLWRTYSIWENMYHQRKHDDRVFLEYQIVTLLLIKNSRSEISLSKIKIWDSKFGTKWTLLCWINIFIKNRSQLCAINFVLFLHVICAFLQKWKYQWLKMKS